MPIMRSSSPSSPFLLLFVFLFVAGGDGGASLGVSRADGYAAEQQPLNPGDFTTGSGVVGGGPETGNTVPAFPVVQAQNNQTCHLDLSDELFGGVAEACGRDLDRGRCCPVLAAWLFAAHARSALEVRAPSDDEEESGAALGSDMPMMPDDSQKCVDSLQSSLQRRNIYLARPNASCDAVLCFCGIRLHQISSLSCPAAFNVSSSYHNATPTAAVRDLEKNCRNSSYAGCTRCLDSLDKLKGGVGSAGAGAGDRASKMFGRDCQLMGLTWLLARNRTAYIPTVSAVLRAIMYSAHPPPEGRRTAGGKQPLYRCSPDQENMPLAVDSLQFEKLDSSSASAAVRRAGPVGLAATILISVVLLCSLLTQ
uniref:Putative GPI-anchored protein At4g28100 n=1 Tax=Anthurium amnicola TaxID=1678845 RepID=A0A1D1Z509_9ARAE